LRRARETSFLPLLFDLEAIALLLFTVTKLALAFLPFLSLIRDYVCTYMQVGIEGLCLELNGARKKVEIERGEMPRVEIGAP
jgi:hypothetical protein